MADLDIRGYTPPATIVRDLGAGAREVLETIPVELSEEGTRRQLARGRPRPGGIMEDYDKYSDPEPAFAKLYRMVGPDRCQEVHLTWEFRDRYLRKRGPDGKPIFYARPPAPLAEAGSDPCPILVGSQPCGRRMTNQMELLRHILKKHREEAPLYLTQDQLNRARGAMAIGDVAVVRDDAPAPFAAAPEAAKAPEAPVEPAAPAAPVAMAPVVTSSARKPYPAGHTCGMAYPGSFGKYDTSCSGCRYMMAHPTAKTLRDRRAREKAAAEMAFS